jgi:hypothetical protein
MKEIYHIWLVATLRLGGLGLRADVQARRQGQRRVQPQEGPLVVGALTP